MDKKRKKELKKQNTQKNFIETECRRKHIEFRKIFNELDIEEYDSQNEIIDKLIKKLDDKGFLK